MKLTNKIFSYAIAKAKQSKLMQSLFEAPLDLASMSKMGMFTDSNGYQHILFNGLRSKIKPGWERMLQNTSNYIGEPDYDKAVIEGRANFLRMSDIIKTYGKNINGANILEIGCHLGAVCYSFAETGNYNVTGTEYTGYKVSALDSDSSIAKLEKVSSRLQEQRTILGIKFKNADKVKFLEDDICNSVLPDESFDIIISYDVLEHLHDPGAAFKQIHRILKKDGIAVHDYNPFFSLNGGHSLCTLDFPWGHCRLNKSDFVKYVQDMRPIEKEPAISFFNEGLNRMTMSSLKELTIKAGLEITGTIKFSKEQHLRMVTADILTQSQKQYPGLIIDDLVSPKVLIIQRKL